jgi:hypothetical protein
MGKAEIEQGPSLTVRTAALTVRTGPMSSRPLTMCPSTG